MHTVNNIKNKTFYDCMPVVEKNHHFQFIGHNVYVINSTIVKTLNRQEYILTGSTNKEHLKCNKPFEIHPIGQQNSDGISLSPQTDCVDMFNGKLHALKCPATAMTSPNYADYTNFDINTINKCCPLGYSYERHERHCIRNDQDMEIFKSSFLHDSKIIFSINKPPHCTDDEVFVEYHSNSHIMLLKEHTLKILLHDKNMKHQSDVLKSKSYCVEGLVESISTMVDNDDVNNINNTNNNNNNNYYSDMYNDDNNNNIVINTNNNNNSNNSNNSSSSNNISNNYDSNNNNNKVITFLYNDKASIIVRACRPRTICDKIPCIRRCCKTDAMLARVNGTAQCVDYHKNLNPIFHDVSLPFTKEKNHSTIQPREYGTLQYQTCLKFILDDTNVDDQHYISHIDGSLYVAAFEEPFMNSKYCTDYLEMGDEIQVKTFVCYDLISQNHFVYYAIGSTISCIFLFLTLVVYICLPRLLNLQGKTLICYVITLLIAYVILSIIQFNTNEIVPHCHLLAYIMFFFFISAFCWQSIMCFDIWWTFRSVRASRVMRKSKELRRFLIYILYAWGVPCIITMITFSVNHYELVSEKWRPTFGSSTCWFQGSNWRGHFLFFLLPNGIHVFTNAILFILTSIHCNKVKNEIHRMQMDNQLDMKKTKRRFIADKAKKYISRFTMNFKLFIVMGVSWTLEIIATLYQTPAILWQILDTFNILQGVLVCLIFVCKKKVFISLSQRLGCSEKTKRGMTTMGTGTSTVATRDILHDPYSSRAMRKSSSTSTIGVSPKNSRKQNK